MTTEDLELQAEAARLTIDLAASRERRRIQADAHAKELADLNQKLHQQAENSAVREAVKAAGPWVTNEQDLKRLLEGQLRLIDGKLQATDKDGNVLVGRHGAMSATEFLQQYRQKHSYLTPSQNKATPAKENAAESEENLRRLFGRKSEGWYASKVAREDIQEYRRLRTLAKERKIW